jgi:hypothetical protein
MTPAALRIVFAVSGLLCLGLTFNDLRRGATTIAGIAYSRVQHPMLYWGMIGLTAVGGAALLAGAVSIPQEAFIAALRMGEE